MKDKYEGCYIDGYKDHYAVFADNGEKLAEYDTHKEAKEDIAEWEAEVKNESYIPADTLATGYRFTIHETELLENAIKKHVEQKVDRGVNAMFDTDSEEFKKVGNEPYDKSQWWDDMKLTMRIKKTPFPRKNGYTNGDFRPNQKWLMGAIECCKSARDCEYLLKDAYLSVAHDKKLIQNLKSVRDGTPNKYVNVKVVQKWLDNGVTPEKVEKHIEWFKANYIKGLQAKKKEFNKAQNETVTEDPMNEDHSEISNDPEMEELMALAGVTTADLDDLENDNDLDLDEDDPIDANTLREIDAAMDESVKSAINNIELATKGMDVNIEQIEKFIPVAKDFLKYMKSAPIAYDENTGDGLKIKNDTVDFINKCLKFDYDRGSDDELKIIGRNWIKYNLATLFDKLSFNNKKVSPAQLELYKKCVKGGEFDKRLQKCYNELKAILKELNDFYDQLAKKLGSDFEKTVNYKMLNSFGNEYNYFWGQYCFTTGDKNATMKYAGRTRVSFFGKKIRDSINESVGGVIAISVAGLIGGAAIVNAITERKLKAEAKELTKAEFDKLINDMVSINEAVISKLKTSKWWKFIYEPCMNRKNSPDIHNQASKYKQEFMSGKCIGPSFHSSFVDIDDPDPKIYTKLDAEIGRSPDDEAWEKAFDSAYYESQKLIKEAVKKLGFNDEGKSTKYPDIKIDIGSGEYIGIWIEPIYNGYYKLKDTKKSQNETAETDLDILLSESAEFLFDE